MKKTERSPDWRGGRPSTHLTLYTVTKLMQRLPNPVGMVALNLERFVLDGSARAATSLQASEQLGKVVALGRQPAHDGHLFAPLAFFYRQSRRLCFWRNPRGRRRRGGRAIAHGFQITALLTPWRTVQWCAFKQSHGRFHQAESTGG